MKLPTTPPCMPCIDVAVCPMLCITSPNFLILSTPAESISGRFFKASNFGAISLILLIKVSILAPISASPPVNMATKPLIVCPIFISPLIC